jgi:predicted transcriptional regulator
MITASELISHQVFPLKKNDTVEGALMMMHDWKVTCLPVVDAGEVSGYCEISELSASKPGDKIIHHMQHQQVSLSHGRIHLFEIIRLFAEHRLSTITLSLEDKFSGIITGYDLLDAYKQSALSQTGAIIQMQMPSRNYSLAEISRLIESNDVKILHLFISSMNDDEGHIEISIKLNSVNIKNVLSTLERYQYQITGIFQAAEIDDSFRTRFENLIKYLDI